MTDKEYVYDVIDEKLGNRCMPTMGPFMSTLSKLLDGKDRNCVNFHVSSYDRISISVGIGFCDYDLNKSLWCQDDIFFTKAKELIEEIKSRPKSNQPF